MKNSHLITPRTLGDCSFIASADPIESYRGGYSPSWWCWMTCIAIVSAVLVWVTR
jgi:hypothetical protein